MKNNNKIKTLLDSTNTMIVLSVLAATLGAFLASPSAGLLSTFQATLIISVIAALFIKKPVFIPISFFLVSFLFTFAGEKPVALADKYGDYSLTVALRSLGVSLLGCAAVYLIKGEHKPFKGRIPTAIAASALVIAATLWSAGASGTPWGYLKAQSYADGFLAERFELEGVTVSGMYKIPWEDKYACDITAIGTNSTAVLICSGDRIDDTVTEMFSEKITADAEVRLTSAIRSRYPEGNFEVVCKYSGIYTEKLSLSNENSVSKYLDYTVNILSEETAKSFVVEAEKYYSAVCASSFPCNSLTVNGGIRTKLYYSISGNPYVPRSKCDYRMTPYSTTLLPTSAWTAAFDSFGK